MGFIVIRKVPGYYCLKYQEPMATSDVIFEVKPSQLNNVFYFIGQMVFLALVLYYAQEAQALVYGCLDWLNGLFGDQYSEYLKPAATTAIILLLAMPGFSICWRYLETHMRVYTFREDRLVFQFGVLNRNKDNVEYYRIKDFYSDAPFWMRPFSLSNFHLISTDRRSPYLKVPGIQGVEANEDKIRDAIEKACMTGRGQEIDIV